MNYKDWDDMTRDKQCDIALFSLSLDAAEEAFRRGLCSKWAWNWYTVIWTWGAPRYTGVPGWKQDDYYKRCGAEALQRRHARVLVWRDKLIEKIKQDEIHR
jgi:hypothetical protein